MMSKFNVLTHLLRDDFETFARKSIAALNGGTKFDDPYLRLLFATLEKAATGPIRRLVVNMPPRHLKTQSGIALVAWLLARDPTLKAIIVCYGEDLAKGIAESTRRILDLKWYQKAFPATRIGDIDNATRFTTTAGGRVLATSFGARLTGQGADFIIVDDPHKIEDASHPEKIRKVVDTFESAVESRLDRPSVGRIVVLTHRVSGSDLSAHLIADDEWSHLKLPFVAESDCEYEMEDFTWHRKKGDLLRVAEYSLKKIEKLRRIAGPPNFQTLYQQSPPDEKTLILEEDFPRYSGRPTCQTGSVVSIDWAPGVRGSFSVAQIWLPVGPDFYLVEQWRARVPYDEFIRAIRRIIVKFRGSVVLIEGGALAPAISAHVGHILGRDSPLIEIINPNNQSKSERLARVTDLIKGKRVCIPERAEWTDEFLEEIVCFPDAKTDDQVDALSQALAWLRDRPQIPRPPARCVAARASPFTRPARGPYIFARSR